MIKKLLLIMLMFAPLYGFSKPPPTNGVFHLIFHISDPNTLSLEWQIKPGYFLYQERTKVTNALNSNIQLGAIRLPPALQQQDKQGHLIRVYRNNLKLPIAILGTQPGESLLTVNFQGCSDQGYCYPPETQIIKLVIDKQLALTEATIEPDTFDAQITPQTNPNAIYNLMLQSNWAIILLSFFGFGLLLSFTPCILPMIPILSGIIVGHEKNVSVRKAFLLSLSYVLSMSVTYALVGAIVALLGHNLQIFLQTPVAVCALSIIFVILALSMFDLYTLQLPKSWQAKLASITRSQSGGHYLNAAIMGCLSILILSPCVTAPMIGALSYIAQTGHIAFGSLSLFFLSLGMGTPLLLIGGSAGHLLPKAGHWMNAIKIFFGIILLAIALNLLTRLLPTILSMILWGSFLLYIGIFLGAFTKANTTLKKAAQGLGLLAFIYGILILIGASFGNSNIWQPLTNSHERCERPNTIPTSVQTIKDVNNIIREAQHKPIILDFYAAWCVECNVMTTTTLRDPRILEELKKFIIITVDLTPNNADSRALLRYFDVVAPPTFIFLNTAGDIMPKYTLVGDVTAERFLNTMSQVLQQ